MFDFKLLSILSKHLWRLPITPDSPPHTTLQRNQGLPGLGSRQRPPKSARPQLHVLSLRLDGANHTGNMREPLRVAGHAPGRVLPLCQSCALVCRDGARALQPQHVDRPIP
jgi:hypothetical protein